MFFSSTFKILSLKISKQSQKCRLACYLCQNDLQFQFDEPLARAHSLATTVRYDQERRFSRQIVQPPFRPVRSRVYEVIFVQTRQPRVQQHDALLENKKYENVIFITHIYIYIGICIIYIYLIKIFTPTGNW